MMTTITKKLHVHFLDDVTNPSTSTLPTNDDGSEDKSDTLSYSRNQLLLLRNCTSAQMRPIFFDEMNDQNQGRRREKINHLLRSTSKGNLDQLDSTNVDMDKNESSSLKSAAEERTALFGKLIESSAKSGLPFASAPPFWRNENGKKSSSVENATLKLDDLSEPTKLPDDCVIDYRTKFKEFRSGYNTEFAWNKHRNNGRPYGRFDNRSREPEPEWMACGPISQDDVIELHGFKDGNDSEVNKGRGPNGEITAPPARSTPTKMEGNKVAKQNAGEHFNFEDFLNVDLNGNSRHTDNGESRFTRWFRKENSPKSFKPSEEISGNSDFATADKFFELMQKSKGKKPPGNLATMSTKFRSVEELEAEICTPANSAQSANTHMPRETPFQQLMSHINTSKKPTLPVNINLQEILNKNAYQLFQYQLAQDLVLQRPEAQIILQRLSCNEITLLHVLQQLNDRRTSSLDRETLMAVVNYVNSQNRVHQHCKQQKKQLQMQAQLQRLQLMNTPPPYQNSFMQRPPTPEELQLHTQNIMQNALMKKQLEDQFRMMQQHRGTESSPMNFFHNMRNATGFNGGDKMQPPFNHQGFQPNYMRKPGGMRYPNKGMGFHPHQQSYQSPKMGRRLQPQQHNNIFTLSSAPAQRKWNNQQSTVTESSTNPSAPVTPVETSVEVKTSVSNQTQGLMQTSCEAEK